jgi:hypothetical protein
MACEAAKKAVLKKLPVGLEIGFGANDIALKIGWWTRETIEEALTELADAGKVWRKGNLYGRQS